MSPCVTGSGDSDTDGFSASVAGGEVCVGVEPVAVGVGFVGCGCVVVGVVVGEDAV